MAEAEVVWHVLMPITAEVIAGAPRLKLIQKIGVGLNTIDLEAARARGIKVCNMPETNSRAVAEMTLALMLAALRRLPAFDSATRAGRGWPLEPEVQDNLGELAGRTVGLVGFGAVPRLLVPVLKALGARVLYTARAPKPGADAEWRALPDLLAEADVVSLHVPLTPDTVRMIDGAAIARMKPGIVLVNTARGGLIDEAALVAALASGRIRAAGLDVFALEPVRADNPLLRLDNVVLTPHVAWLTAETWERSLTVAVENCRRLVAGRPLLHQVM
jgi:phosphoglycerate dehydrogenase-like enzyme